MPSKNEFLHNFKNQDEEKRRAEQRQRDAQRDAQERQREILRRQTQEAARSRHRSNQARENVNYLIRQYGILEGVEAIGIQLRAGPPRIEIPQSQEFDGGIVYIVLPFYSRRGRVQVPDGFEWYSYEFEGSQDIGGRSGHTEQSKRQKYKWGSEHVLEDILKLGASLRSESDPDILHVFHEIYEHRLVKRSILGGDKYAYERLSNSGGPNGQYFDFSQQGQTHVNADIERYFDELYQHVSAYPHKDH